MSGRRAGVACRRKRKVIVNTIVSEGGLFLKVLFELLMPVVEAVLKIFKDL